MNTKSIGLRAEGKKREKENVILISQRGELGLMVIVRIETENNRGVSLERKIYKIIRQKSKPLDLAVKKIYLLSVWSFLLMEKVTRSQSS